jgi:hypothetical protein
MPQIELPNLTNLATEGSEALTEARKYVCRSDADLKTCGTFFAWVKARKKEIKAELAKDLEPKIEMLDDLHSQGVALRNKILAPYDLAEDTIEGIMRPYVLQKKSEADAEKRRLQQEAIKAAQEEKELLQLQAEIEGRPEEAAMIEQLAPVPAVVKMAPAVPKQEGMSMRGKWRWEIVNEDLIPRDYWMLNEVAINAQVKKLGDKCDIPGIKVIEDVSFAG